MKNIYKVVNCNLDSIPDFLCNDLDSLFKELDTYFSEGILVNEVSYKDWKLEISLVFDPVTDCEGVYCQEHCLKITKELENKIWRELKEERLERYKERIFDISSDIVDISLEEEIDYWVKIWYNTFYQNKPIVGRKEFVCKTIDELVETIKIYLREQNVR